MPGDFIDFVSIQLKKEREEALYVQLYRQLREMIVDGKVSHGYLLPPVRKFAAYLGINAGTVMRAYKELENNGYIFSRSGSGSYVAELPETAQMEESGANESEFDAPEAIFLNAQWPYINLAGIALSPDLVSVDAFKQVLNEVLDRDKGYAFSYQESQGFYPLRESIAAHLKKYGVKADAGNVQIISGAQQGIDIVAKAFLHYGDYVFTENPTYPGAIAAFRSRGAKIVEVSMRSDGIDMEDLEVKLKKFRPKLIYVMPNLQNPTGYSYSRVKRSRLMGLCRYYRTFILEDDYISELGYGKRQMAPLKAIDRDDRVIYLKSFSKIFMPGLRLAFLTIPEGLIPKILAVKQNSDISTSGLTQRAFDLYLRKGIWHAHIAEICSLYKERYAFTLAMLKKYLPPETHIAIPEGGLSIWIALPEGLSARGVVGRAKQEGVLVTEGESFFPRQAPDKYLRVSFATASCREIENGIGIIARIMKQGRAGDKFLSGGENLRIEALKTAKSV